MANTVSASTPTLPPNHLRSTTKRGISTSAFTLGFWSLLTFWMYPFGLIMSFIALTLGVISITLGWRAGKDGEHLAWLGVFFALTAQGLAIVSFRGVQLAFEGTLPPIIQNLL